MSNELYHYGVLGMKWGVRRANKKANKKSKEKVSDLSDQELRNKINRLQMEKQYKELSRKQSVGKKALGNFIKVAGTIVAVDTAVNTYKKYGNMAIKKIGDVAINKLMK